MPGAIFAMVPVVALTATVIEQTKCIHVIAVIMSYMLYKVPLE